MVQAVRDLVAMMVLAGAIALAMFQLSDVFAQLVTRAAGF